MKKVLVAIVLVLAGVLSWFIWGQGETYTIHVSRRGIFISKNSPFSAND